MSGAEQPPGDPAPGPGPASAAPRGLVEGIWQGQVLFGWAADPQDASVRPVIRLMRGVEVLAEVEAGFRRGDGHPGFQVRAPWPLPPQMLLDGQIRVRAMLPGRHAAVTLPIGPALRAALEAAVPGSAPEPAETGPPLPDPQPAPMRVAESRPAEPALDFEPAEPALDFEPAEPALDFEPAEPAGDAEAAGQVADAKHATVPGSVQQAPDAKAAPAEDRPAAPTPRSARPEVPPGPRADPEGGAGMRSRIETGAAALERSPSPATPFIAAPPPAALAAPLAAPLADCLALARQADACQVPVLHLLVPRRADVLAGEPGPGLAALEAAAAAEPLLARDWVPLRHHFQRIGHPAALWRQNGSSLSVEGTLALLDLLLAVLRLRSPGASAGLATAARLLARIDLPALPRRAIPDTAALEAARDRPERGLLRRSPPETEPALPADLFADLPEPRRGGAALPGLETWSRAGAPLPWRVVVMAAPGLGGSAGPAHPGWWLRHLVAECVLSEALHGAAPAAVLAAAPDLLLTLMAEAPA